MSMLTKRRSSMIYDTEHIPTFSRYLVYVRTRWRRALVTSIGGAGEEKV
jgi:hypothetical protein